MTADYTCIFTFASLYVQDGGISCSDKLGIREYHSPGFLSKNLANRTKK